jgi:hypothetical protein
MCASISKLKEKCGRKERKERKIEERRKKYE